jgi:uncharacterized protein YeaO (DUF488 family)
MTVRVVRLGSPRIPGEGLRLGTVRHPPRGVAKARYAAENWFDLWYPVLAPSAALLSRFKGTEGESAWRDFARAFLMEMRQPAPRHTLELLAALSHQTDFSVGCYCTDETRCHRSLLRTLLAGRRARIE